MKRRFQCLAILGVTSVALSIVGANAAPAAPSLTGRGTHPTRVSPNSSTVRFHFTAEQLRSQIAQWVDREGYKPATMLNGLFADGGVVRVGASLPG